MPTGYTAKLYEGEQSFEDFAKSCARGFGAFIRARDYALDARLPDDFWEPGTYNAQRLSEAKSRLARLETLTEDDAETEARNEYEAACESFRSRRADRNATRARYEDMLLQVEAWEPPTAEHVKFKEFMLDQLRGSISFDTGSTPEPPKHLSGSEWLAKEIEKANRDIEYHAKEHAAEVKRCAEAKTWATALWDSLRKVGESA